MLAKTGLLIVSNPTQIGKTLSSIEKYVNKTLYIQLLSALNDSLGAGFHPNIFTSCPKYSQTIYGIYCQAASSCQNLDVKVLLSGLKYNKLKTTTLSPVDLVIFDKSYPQNEIDNFVNTRIQNIAMNYKVLTLDAGIVNDISSDNSHSDTDCSHTVLGGTFDRLHIAHKLLLSESALRSRSKVTVGVTEEIMLKSKLLWELIQDTSTRIEGVKNFLTEICPELEINVVPISDPFGPAITDPTMELIVVSAETVKGGEKINEIRESKGLRKLEIVSLDLMNEPFRESIEEAKISSSTSRIRLLGSYLKPPVPNNNIPKRPYVIGLTGGIASGKSGVANSLDGLGAYVIDCDKIAHQAYEPGKPCYNSLVEHFGNSIVASTGQIDRKVLGGIVFSNPDQMKKLNSIVWPAIAEEVNIILHNCPYTVAVVEAAVLLPAGWTTFCHEVWTTIIPREEAVRRLQTRNNLTEEQAVARLNSQPPNTEYVNASNVVFCTLWEYAYTKQQVKKAWNLLQNRLDSEELKDNVDNSQ